MRVVSREGGAAVSREGGAAVSREGGAARPGRTTTEVAQSPQVFDGDSG